MSLSTAASMSTTHRGPDSVAGSYALSEGSSPRAGDGSSGASALTIGPSTEAAPAGAGDNPTLHLDASPFMQYVENGPNCSA